MKPESFEYSIAKKDIQHKEEIGHDDFKEWQEKILNQIQPETKARGEAIVTQIQQSVYADVEEGALADKIEGWIEQAKGEIEPIDLTDDSGDITSFEAESWMYFQSLARVRNTQSLEQSIATFRKEEEVDERRPLNLIEKGELLKELQERFPFSQKELQQLIDFHEDMSTEAYVGILPAAKTFGDIWKTYNLGRDKKQLAKIAIASLISKFLESFSSYVYKDLLQDNKLQLGVFVESALADGTGSVIEQRTQRYQREFFIELNRQLNEKIVKALVLQDFEHMEGKAPSDVIDTVERGRSAVHSLVEGILFKLGPMIAGMAMSMALLTEIHPILGASGFVSMPLMLYLAKKRSERNLVYEISGTREERRIKKKLEALQTGLETVRTSEMAPEIAQEVTDLMNRLEDIGLQQLKTEEKADVVNLIMRHAVDIMSASVGFALQQAGLIEGGAILANIKIMREMRWPLYELNAKFQRGYASEVLNIQRLQKLLGEVKKSDTTPPEERELTSTKELPNFDIEVSDLGYGEILKNVTMTVHQGEFVVISGPTGVGKSTLLRNIVGIYKPTRGEVKIGGTPVNQLRRHGPDSLYSSVAYSTQDTVIFSDMTLRENLLLWSKEASIGEKVEEILRNLHLEKLLPRLDEPVKHLSGGERARVGVARILLRQPKIIFMDEPTASLDSATATDVVNFIKLVHASYPETTIVCISHDDRLISAGREISMKPISEQP